MPEIFGGNNFLLFKSSYLVTGLNITSLERCSLAPSTFIIVNVELLTYRI